MKKAAILLVTVLLAVALTGCSVFSSTKGDTIVIGGKNFTEQDVLVFIMKELLENKTKLKAIFHIIFMIVEFHDKK